MLCHTDPIPTYPPPLPFNGKGGENLEVTKLNFKQHKVLPISFLFFAKVVMVNFAGQGQFKKKKAWLLFEV